MKVRIFIFAIAAAVLLWVGVPLVKDLRHVEPEAWKMTGIFYVAPVTLLIISKLSFDAWQQRRLAKEILAMFAHSNDTLTTGEVREAVAWSRFEQAKNQGKVDMEGPYTLKPLSFAPHAADTEGALEYLERKGEVTRPRDAGAHSFWALPE